jgi:hypothetical protein
MIESLNMPKDTRLTFRVESDLKKNLEAIAAFEGRSTGQICEAFLKSGTQHYKRQGGKLLQKFLTKKTQP